MKPQWLFAVTGALLLSGMIGEGQQTAPEITVLIRGANGALSVSNVVAGAGDTVSVSEGRVVVNGKITNAQVDATGNWGPRRIEAGLYFVAGDPARLGTNPLAWGLVSQESIVGTVDIGKLPSR
jgi:hypothetical protein